MLADVDAGSDTPSLVGKVLQWRKDKSDQGGVFFFGSPIRGNSHLPTSH